MKKLAIETIELGKVYATGSLLVPALYNLNLQIKEGELVAIMGPSGCGKSTLMNIIGLLDRPTSGELRLNGEQIDLTMSDSKLAKIRGQQIGFVFQSFNLLPKISALANVLMPTSYQANRSKHYRQQAISLLKQVGLTDRTEHRPTQLSGGEKQRVAIARALINNPQIILADEPTGNLDSKSGQEIINLLNSLHLAGKTVVIITHDQTIGNQCDRIVKLKDGRNEV